MRAGVSVAVVALLTAVPACASDGSRSSTSITTPSGTAAICAWKVRADKETLNIAYPDTSATYWGLRYALAPGEHLRLSGRFPAARYASFVSYGVAGGPIDVLTDLDIDPDRGSVNPFRAAIPSTGAAGSTRRRYTIRIRPDTGPTGAPNMLAARAVAGSTTTTAPTTTPGADAMVVVGGGGPDATTGTVLYRVYLPDHRTDPTGGAGLPHVALVDASGTVTRIPTCATPGPSQAAIDIVNHLHRTFNPAPPEPLFIRPDAGQLNLYPNPDNVYVATRVTHEPGRIVVVRGRAPTFPDTRHGAPVAGDAQVRFWSLCTNELRKPYPVTDCAADDATTLDADGSYTYVVSTRADRPVRTPATAGSTWLDWGSTKVDVLLLLRNMLASPSFAGATDDVAPGALVTTTMGSYAPRGAYCSKVAFEQGGYAACGL